MARLASQGVPAGEFCGLVLACSWPMPRDVLEAYEALRAELLEAMPPQAYLYPGSTLHCTVLTLRAFTAGSLDGEARERVLTSWGPVLDAARSSTEWPSGPFRLLMKRPTLEGSAAIFRYEDSDGAVARMRGCLRRAIADAGGLAAEGPRRDGALPLPGSPEGDPAPHLPDIVHSTVLRWGAEPEDRERALQAFDRAAERWEPREVLVPCAKGILEDVPYMHVAGGDGNVWWRSEL